MCGALSDVPRSGVGVSPDVGCRPLGGVGVSGGWFRLQWLGCKGRCRWCWHVRQISAVSFLLLAVLAAGSMSQGVTCRVVCSGRLLLHSPSKPHRWNVKAFTASWLVGAAPCPPPFPHTQITGRQTAVDCI